MTTLTVPFVEQISNCACGAAALEMVVRYYRPSKLTKFSQAKMIRLRSEHEPLGTGNYRITTDNIVSQAHGHGFGADWGRVSPVQEVLTKQVTHFVDKLRMPLIACQRSNHDYMLGHFRVIIGAEKTGVIIHDPDEGRGGARQVWTWDKLLDHWKQTGPNVTGGVAIWISNDPISPNPLAPDQPNAWDSHPWSPSLA
jgi:ABC-type bacteriocin/lantibiotic exporter with double-glycine peptidase domain